MLAGRHVANTRHGLALLISVQDRAHGRELRKSNGTSAGTVLVRDIRPGPRRSI
jgi:ELWxxDGT repeat protein